MSSNMSYGITLKSWARITGLLGLIVLISGSYTHTINSSLVDLTNIPSTVTNLVEFESSYRLGFVSGLMMETIFIIYAFLLYKLLRPIDQNAALLMLILALVPAPIFFINQLTHFSVLLAAQENMTQEVMLLLHQHKQGGLIISIFFGLWLLPLGYLVYKSKILPKIIGIALMIASLGYLISFVQGTLLPGTEKTLWTNPMLIITHLSEISLMLWLLIMGIDMNKYSSNR